MWRLINVTHWRKGCEKHGIKAACGPTTHTCCTMCLQSWWWWRWLSLVLLCLSPANPSLSPAAAGSEQAMGPAFPVHEAAVRAEGIVRVMGTPGLTPASPRGSQGILSAVHAASLAAALNCGCPPRPSVDPSLCL